jgi:hypothetical protein
MNPKISARSSNAKPIGDLPQIVIPTPEWRPELMADCGRLRPIHNWNDRVISNQQLIHLDGRVRPA